MSKSFIALGSVCLRLTAAVIVAHADLGQTGAFSDTTLTTLNVNAATFGKVGSFSTDTPIFAQPLVVPGSPNLLIVATTTNKVYGFNADLPNSPALWIRDFGDSRHTWPGHFVNGETLNRLTSIGIFGTPVADSTAGTLYVVSASSAAWILYQLSLSTGAILQQVTIQGHVTGTGDTGDSVIGGQLQFNPLFSLQRAGLTLANGKVYVGFGSFNDQHPWHGWLFAYNTADFSQAAIFCTTPNTGGGAIWQSGGAPAVDGSGNLYVTTGNDSSISDGTNFGESVLKLSPTLSLLDWFTPSTFASLDSVDADVSAGRPILLRGTSQLLVASKNLTVYSVDSACMGHVEGSNINCTLQKFATANQVVSDATGAFGAVVLNGSLYVPTTTGTLYAFSSIGGIFNAVPLIQANVYGFPGPAQMAAANGIVWIVASPDNSNFDPGAGRLRALRASDFTELWNSDQTPGDTLGRLAKFTSPVIANGKVYVPNQDGQVQVYGLR